MFFCIYFFHKICFCQLLSIECKKVTKRKCIYHFQSVTWSSILLTDKSFILYLFFSIRLFFFLCQFFFFSLSQNCLRSGEPMTACQEHYNRANNYNNSMNKKKNNTWKFLSTSRFDCYYCNFRFLLFFVVRNSPVYRN